MQILTNLFLVVVVLCLNIVLQIPLLTGSLLLSPFLFVGFYLKNKRLCTHSILSIYILVLYGTLFLSRYLVDSVYAADSYFGRVIISSSDLSLAARVCAVFTFSFLSGICVNHFPKGRACKWQLLGSQNTTELLWFEHFSKYGSLLSIASFLVFIFESGNSSQLLTTLVFHEKQIQDFNTIATLGLSIWSITASISLTFALHFTIETRSRRLIPHILMISLILVFILGSRLDIFTVLGNVAILQLMHKGKLPTGFFVTSGILMFPVFFIILKLRNAVNTGGKGLYDWITYPILDASQVVLLQSRESFTHYLNIERFYQLAVGYIPRFIYPDKPSVQNLRLDTIVANSLGTSLQKGRTGWPTGAFTELFLFGGFFFTCLFAVCSGFLISAWIEKLQLSSFNSGIISLRILLLFSFVLTWFKDGDFFISIQGFVRYYIYLQVFGRVIYLIDGKKGEKSE